MNENLNKDKSSHLENSALHICKESMMFSEMSIFYMSSIVSSSKNHWHAHLKKKNCSWWIFGLQWLHIFQWKFQNCTGNLRKITFSMLQWKCFLAFELVWPSSQKHSTKTYSWQLQEETTENKIFMCLSTRIFICIWTEAERLRSKAHSSTCQFVYLTATNSSIFY